MSFGVLRERPAHRLSRDVAQRHCGEIPLAADDERCDRVEVLAVGLHGVWRQLARATVCQERREPLRAQN